MSSPYRERPAFLLCPRCAEVLDAVAEGTSACARCAGMWITTHVLDAAFGNPRWPGGMAAWWRNELRCPECQVAGRTTTLEARAVEDVVVDHCPQHGLWLDAGELGRLVGMPISGRDEVAELQKRVAANAPDPDRLRQRREDWRRQLDASRAAATAFRSELEERHRAQTAPPTIGRESPAIAKLRSERLALLEQIGKLETEIAALHAQSAQIKEQLARRETDLSRVTLRYQTVDAQLKTGVPT